MSNDTTTIDISSSKAIHSLVNSITLVNVNKDAANTRVPVPSLPGIRPTQQVAIRPAKDQSSILLSKVSIHNHPHKEDIIALAKEIHLGEPKHLHKGKNARDYLLQAKAMFETSQKRMEGPSRPQPKQNPFNLPAPKVLFAQTVKEGKQCGSAVFLPKLGPTNIPVAPKLTTDWQTVQRKKPHNKERSPQWCRVSSH